MTAPRHLDVTLVSYPIKTVPMSIVLNPVELCG